MKKITKYIIEKLIINKKTADNDEKQHSNNVAKEIYDVLSDPTYKLNFGKVKGNTVEDFISLMDNKDLKRESDILEKCFTPFFDIRNPEKYPIYEIKIWNNGSLYFSGKPRYSQGEIVNCYNNTNFRYYILVDDKQCYLVGTERKYYGQKDDIGRLYKFNIK